MPKLTNAEHKEAIKLLKYFGVKLKKSDPNVFASAIIGMVARMCYVEGDRDVMKAVKQLAIMSIDIKDTIVTLDRIQNETDTGVRN
jgi:hypothetical protein